LQPAQAKDSLEKATGPQQVVEFHPLGRGNPMQLVIEAMRYFGLHFRDPLEIPELAHALGTSVSCLDCSFERIRGVTPVRALQEYRLNKLFVTLTDQPRLGLGKAIRACGLGQTPGVVALFEREFGIDMPLFLLTCRRAAEDRLFRLQHPEAEALVLPI
jgi:transcriptional regulator GlxA family with amidase domain